ncbi:IQ domain-containing protein IQM3-like [Andrographis paniculata]|uniref:IQ domain-containing protein IQM3-like n=1 Tax=Andrographis paniculata TaxID=175694 RepID=UPI0021E7FA3E|nr:IQ domain-containing protein IQM3-like [Andrographis paniculata]
MEGEGGGDSSLNLNCSSIPDFSRRSHCDADFCITHVSGSSEPSTERKKVNDQMAEIGGRCEASGAPARTPTDLTMSAVSAALKLQKVYRSYRTRRMLADSAVLAELWWQAIDFARLNHRTISFFNYTKPEPAASKWNRVGLNASKVGKGLAKDGKAQKLAFQHWIEAIDPRHRYGHNLHYYYDEWCKTNGGQPFFYWLDLGDGKEVDLKECPRSKLRKQCIKYLGPKEREHYEYVISKGKVLHKLTGKPLETDYDDTSAGSKWIFVMSTSKRLYTGEKKKGLFHHSSFLAGGATLAAGRLSAKNGDLKGISAYSGHYKPSDESLDIFLSFLKENGVDLNQAKICKGNEDYSENIENSMDGTFQCEQTGALGEFNKCDQLRVASKAEEKRSLSGGVQSSKADVPRSAIMERINSKTTSWRSYQLGHQISTKWSTGAGPRIGCIGDYPVELRLQALAFTKISPAPLLSPPANDDSIAKPS